MKPFITAIKLMLASFIIPWLVMASLFAMSQTNPPKITVPVLKETMSLTPVWHNLPTAYRNQHRLVIAGFPLAVFCAVCLMMINPNERKTVGAFTLGVTVLVALAANGLDCSWLFRTRPDLIQTQTLLRSIPWVVIGIIALWIMTGKQKVEPSPAPYGSPTTKA
jgi:hypothetical protein